MNECNAISYNRHLLWPLTIWYRRLLWNTNQEIHQFSFIKNELEKCWLVYNHLLLPCGNIYIKKF